MTTLTHEDGFTRAAAERLAQALANTIKAPTHVVQLAERYIIQDNTDLRVYHAGIDPASIVATFEPRGAIECAEPDNLCDVHNPCPAHAAVAARYLANEINPPFDDPLPDDAPGQDIDGVPYPRAQTLQSIAIEAHISTCANCQGMHHTQSCPEVRARLFAPAPTWFDPELGKQLCAMRWKRFDQFRKLIGSVTHETLIAYAASYQAFIRAYRPDTDLTISHILEAWARLSAPESVAA